MAKSSVVEVNFTHSKELAQNAQDSANTAQAGVDNLRNPNMMSVIEKQINVATMAGQKTQYDVVLKLATDKKVDTTTLTSTFTQLQTFVSNAMTDNIHDTVVDRSTYATLVNNYNTALTNVQNSLSTAVNSEMADATSKAEIAQTNADNATSSAETAIATANSAVDSAQTVSADITKLKDGSTETIATLASGIQSKVSNDDFKSEVTQLNNTIQASVSDNDNLVPYSGYWTDTTGWALESWGATDGVLSAVKHNFYHDGQDNLLYIGTAQTAGKSAYSLRFPVEPNTTYTVAFSGFASGNVKGTGVYFLGRNYGSTNDYDSGCTHNIVDGLKMSPSGINRYQNTFTTSANEHEGYIRLDNGGSTNGESSGIYIAEIKMERGSKATPYVKTFTQAEQTITDGDINLKVSKGDVTDQINVEAGKTLIKSGGQLTLAGNTVAFDTTNPVIIPSANIGNVLVSKKLTGANITANTFSTNNGTFTVNSAGAVTAKNMTVTGGTITGTTVNGSTINGASIKGGSYYGGTVSSSYGNTYYPVYIDSGGTLFSTSYHVTNGLPIGNQAIVSSGSIWTRYRELNAFETGKWRALDTEFDTGRLLLTENYTPNQDAKFNSGATRLGEVEIDARTGIELSGDGQGMHFRGKFADRAKAQGIDLNSYGNATGAQNANYWWMGDYNGNRSFYVGLDTANTNPLMAYRDLKMQNNKYIYANAVQSANNYALLKSGNGKAEIGVGVDGTGGRIESQAIYNRTYSSNQTGVGITGSWTLCRNSSASKYKLAITEDADVEPANKLLTINPSTWYDKGSAEMIAKSMSDGGKTEPDAADNVKPIKGLIAEDLLNAGLDDYVVKGPDGTPESIAYDRLWITLIPKVREMQNRLNEQDLTIAKLDARLTKLEAK